MAVNDDSIRDSIKKLLGIDPEDPSYDTDVTMHINSAFSVLHQRGVGPTEPLIIEDASTTWSAFMNGAANIQMVKTYVYGEVKLAFDPPSTEHAIRAIKGRNEEYGWRLQVATETPYVPSQNLSTSGSSDTPVTYFTGVTGG